jgi:hypothetical protein
LAEVFTSVKREKEMLASPVEGYWLLLTCLEFDEALLQDAVTGNAIFTNNIAGY